MKPERLQAFSDGIFAILITILVLEFKLPDYQEGQLFYAVVQQWPILFAYIATYAYIAIIWLFHHDMFGRMSQTNAQLNALNLLSLFLTTLLSYSMSLLAEALATGNAADMSFAFSLYDLLALAISLSYMLLYRYLSKSSSLPICKDGAGYAANMERFPLISMGIYSIAFIVDFFNVYLGLAFLAAGIIFHGYAYWRASHERFLQQPQAKTRTGNQQK